MKELLRRPHLAGIGKGAEVPHQFCPVGRQGMEEVLKFFLDLRYASLHSGLSSFCPYSYAITGEHMQIDESVTSRVGAYGALPPPGGQGQYLTGVLGPLTMYMLDQEPLAALRRVPRDCVGCGAPA